MIKDYDDCVRKWKVMKKDKSVLSLYRMLFSLNAVKFLCDNYGPQHIVSTIAFTDMELVIANDIEDSLTKLFEIEDDETAINTVKDFAAKLSLHDSTIVDYIAAVDEICIDANEKYRLRQSADMFSLFCRTYPRCKKCHIIAMIFLAYMLKDEAPVIFSRMDYEEMDMTSKTEAMDNIGVIACYSINRLHELCGV